MKFTLGINVFKLEDLRNINEPYISIESKTENRESGLWYMPGAFDVGSYLVLSSKIVYLAVRRNIHTCITKNGVPLQNKENGYLCFIFLTRPKSL